MKRLVSSILCAAILIACLSLRMIEVFKLVEIHPMLGMLSNV